VVIKKLLMVVGVVLAVSVFSPTVASATGGSEPACNGAGLCWLM
jgi:uncharacterized membrane protein